MDASTSHLTDKSAIVLHDHRARFVADPAGALVWPDRKLLVVADLHLGKGSSLARHGSLIPPYDTRSTLARLGEVLARWSPDRVISLGDGFHDLEASGRLDHCDRRRLRRFTSDHHWLWITGNHDPLPPDDVGGTAAEAIEIAGLTFRHWPRPGEVRGEIAGHLHPKASVVMRGRRVCRPCFVADRHRVLLPAFGSYAGGLNLLDPALASLFPADYRAWLLGSNRTHMVGRRQIERRRVNLIRKCAGKTGSASL